MADYPYTDDLNRSDETPIGTPYLVAMGVSKPNLESNRLRAVTNAADHYARLDAPNIENVIVQARYVLITGGSSDVALAARMTDETSGNDCYFADWYDETGIKCHLFKVINGAYRSSLATGAAISVNDIIALTVETEGSNARIRTWINGSIDINYLDSSSPLPAGKVAWYSYSTDHGLDDLFAGPYPSATIKKLTTGIRPALFSPGNVR